MERVIDCTHARRQRVNSTCNEKCLDCGGYMAMPAASPKHEQRAADLRREADEAWERGDKRLSTSLHDLASRVRIGEAWA